MNLYLFVMSPSVTMRNKDKVPSASNINIKTVIYDCFYFNVLCLNGKCFDVQIDIL